ncbi:MAG: FAD-dependent oxidoreductase [Clostridiales bacterium]|jgi:NADPH-dependent 2,4-dienoyl-CoA reductase/sulfur reductase-like enzyme|nr:FAD-dependent oxidoreductase [Clostridiales bacterium]
MYTDIAVIGGGPAGMAAALSAVKLNKSVVIFERDERLGGVLNQCIHNGFGIHYFGEELTGPEYAKRFADTVMASSITVKSETTVLSITDDKIITAVNASDGVFRIQAKAVILAMGCRERTAGSIMLAGTRPSGIYTAGTAQKLINTKGLAVGKRAVILGSGDIGLIMARRLTLEGAAVLAVLELMPYSSGLKRNIVQCLDDFGIPLLCNRTITKVVGKDRLEGVYYAETDKNLKPIKETERFLECDTLLLSVGLIPELDLIADNDIRINPATNSAYVDEGRMTSVDGIFAAGNVLHVHNLVDNVSEEGHIAGASAALYADMTDAQRAQRADRINIRAGDGIKYVIPNYINTPSKSGVDLYFKVKDVYKDCEVCVLSDGETIYKKNRRILTPGETEKIRLDGKGLNKDTEVFVRERK